MWESNLYPKKKVFLYKNRQFSNHLDQIIYKLDMNGNGQMVQRDKIISITQFDSADNFERFRWFNLNNFEANFK